MKNPKIDAHKITKPIQLMAVWFITLIVIEYVFLEAATNINEPEWIPIILVISAIIFVPLFLLGIFLLQTKFRNEIQDDHYYSKTMEKKFEKFKPENENPRNKINTSNINRSLNNVRIEKYSKNRGMFLVHSWRPSKNPNQVADIIIWLQEHKHNGISKNNITKLEYELGPKFFDEPQIKTNTDDFFKIEVSAYGPMLCIAKVYLRDEPDPIILERYINFDDIKSI